MEYKAVSKDDPANGFNVENKTVYRNMTRAEFNFYQLAILDLWERMSKAQLAGMVPND